MKNLQNLKGAHQLSKKEQQVINGGAGGGCVEDDGGVCATCNFNEECVAIIDQILGCIIGYACTPITGNQ